MLEIPRIIIHKTKLNPDEGYEVPSFVHKFASMSCQEKEERSSRVYAHTPACVYSKNTDPKVLKAQVNQRYYFETRKKIRVLQFYQSCLVIRNNFSEWEKYISHSTDGVPPPLQFIAGDRELIFGLALLDKCGIIHLNPNEQFVGGERVGGNEYYINIDTEITLECFRDVLPLWGTLGKPSFFGSNIMDRLSDTDFSNSEFVFAETITKYGVWSTKSTLKEALRKHVDEILKWHFFAPIGLYEDTYRLDLIQLVGNVSYVMALEGDDTDILECIRLLFPKFRDLVPSIISEYKSECNYIPSYFDELIHQIILDVHREAFGCGIVPGRDRCDKILLQHRGALRQIENHPELFGRWKYLYSREYYHYVLPALNAKLGLSERL